MKRGGLLLVFLLLLSGIYGQKGKIELGIILGNPSGINGKYWTGEYFALDASLGYNYRHENHLLLAVDFLAHPWSFPVEKDSLQIFTGFGAALGFMSQLGLEARLPFGAAHYFSNVPLVLFAELAPTFRISGPDRPAWLSGYLGIRWTL